MEGYEAITCLELIEHLDPNVLSRFGVVTMGTYRPRLMLITTPVSFCPCVFVLEVEANIAFEPEGVNALQHHPQVNRVLGR